MVTIDFKKTTTCLLKFILAIIFIVMLARSIKKIFKKETGTSQYTQITNNSNYPSISICPFVYSDRIQPVAKEYNPTFEDIQNLPSLVDDAVIELDIYKDFDKRYSLCYVYVIKSPSTVS